ncbi:MAG: hypothetical protein HY823_10190 [Acidobacteria bacterium]|nr:hypothetical protein [Acidobacteriota bacterium]
MGILQGIIQRMASNSGACKAYCVTLVSAILVIVADKGKPQYALIAGIPILLFLALDTYYLGLEKAFRERYKDFVLKYHGDDLVIQDLYEVAPLGGLAGHMVAAFRSFAVFPFYLTLAGMVYAAGRIVIPAK